MASKKGLKSKKIDDDIFDENNDTEYISKDKKSKSRRKVETLPASPDDDNDSEKVVSPKSTSYPPVQTISKDKKSKIKRKVETLPDSSMKHKYDDNDSERAFRPKSSPLPPIPTKINISTISPFTMKNFKNYIVNDSKLVNSQQPRIVECDANVLLTDAHIYELSQLEWPLLQTIHIRACPNITQFAIKYLNEMKTRGKSIEVKIDLSEDNSINHLVKAYQYFKTNALSILTKVFSKTTDATSNHKIKLIIYNSNHHEESQLILNQLQQFRKPLSPVALTKHHKKKHVKDDIFYIGYHTSIHTTKENQECEIHAIECTTPLLFKQITETFYPTIIYITLDSNLSHTKNVQNVLKSLLTIDKTVCTSDYLMKKIFRFIVDKHEFDYEQFLNELKSALNEIKKISEQLYKKLMNEQLLKKSNDIVDDFQRSMQLSKLLHLHTKCQILKKKLSVEECPLFKYDGKSDSQFLQLFLDDVMVNSHETFSFNELDECFKKQNINDVKELLKDIVSKLISNQNSSVENVDFINIAQAYIAQKLLTQNGFIVHDYYVSNLDLYCQVINKVLNMTTQHPHETNDHNKQFFGQFSAIGTNAAFFTEHDLKREIGHENLKFFQTIMNKWNIIHSFTVNDENMFVASTAVPSTLPFPLETVWSVNWQKELDLYIRFHILNPCDESILFSLYKTLPCQKLLIASTRILLIQDGAIEILIQFEDNEQYSQVLTFQFRAINLYSNDDEEAKNNPASQLNYDMLNYTAREYYILTWALLLKLDYAFKVKIKRNETSLTDDDFMHEQWYNISLYHYSYFSTLSSNCAICGMRPFASKSLYDACSILVPSIKNNFNTYTNSRNLYSMIISLSDGNISYNSLSSLRPDGCNQFGIIMLNNEHNNVQNEFFDGSIQIGCIIKNFGLGSDDKITFMYGSDEQIKNKQKFNQSIISNEYEQQQTATKNTDIQSKLLDEIKQFAGFKKKKNTSSTIKDENKYDDGRIYHGLKLHIEIRLTNKPNVFEFIFYINDFPWSHETYKRKSTKTMFQPFFDCTTLNVKISEQMKIFSIAVHYPRTMMDEEVRNVENGVQKSNNFNKTNIVFKKGMRLEAKDRKHPSILAIANIIAVHDDNRITINFDGWGPTYDYTTEVDNADIHPCGYWEYIQRVLYKNVVMEKPLPHSTFNRFDRPQHYQKEFSWRTYLREIDAEPIPYECFSYAQHEGMPIEFFPFGETKRSLTNLSCRHGHNPRVKYQKLFTYVKTELVNQLLTEHKVDDQTSTTPSALYDRGLVLLPTPFNDIETLKYPCLKKFKTDLKLHMTCNHRDISPIDDKKIVSGGHLLDTNGFQITTRSLSNEIITLVMLTAIDLAYSGRRTISPSTSNIITISNNKFLNDFSIRRWLEFIAYIMAYHSPSFFTYRLSSALFANSAKSSLRDVSFSDMYLYDNLSKFVQNVSINFVISRQEREAKTRECQFGSKGECYYCNLFRSQHSKTISDLPIKTRLELVEKYESIIFYLELNDTESIDKSKIILDDAFFERFNSLCFIIITNVKIKQLKLDDQNSNYLNNLIYIRLTNNSLEEINIDFSRLPNLTVISLNKNPLKKLPKNFFAVKNLSSVEFNELGRLYDIGSSMRFSSELKSLKFLHSVLSTLPDKLEVTSKKLIELHANGVPWWSATTGLSKGEVVKYDSFKAAFLSYMDSTEILSAYQFYDKDINGVIDADELNLLNAHLYKFISRFRPTQSIKPVNSPRTPADPLITTTNDSESTNVFALSGIPPVIFQLQNLRTLSLEYQGIKYIPDEIKSLTNLEWLNLNYCIELETLSPQVGLLRLKELNLNGCYSLKTPPNEIVRRGHDKTMAFLQRLVSGSTSCKRTKLMMVGLGGAGKTSLVRAFLAHSSETPPEVTDGIEIKKWEVRGDSGEDDVLEFSVWDFAGQSVYYHTHQFFLAKKAVYVLAWNIRLGAEHAGLDFWLSSISCHAPRAPIFVVGTHADQVSRFDLRQDDYRRRYPQIVQFFNVSTTTGLNIPEFIESLINTSLALPYMGEQIPKAWLNFEILIAESQEDILPYTKIEDIARDSGIFDSSETLQAVQFLHDLGSVQYFPSEHLKRFVVINPQWIVNVMACIVSIKDSPVKDGRLFHKDMSIIWEKYDSNLHPWMLKLTEAFDLTFPVPDQYMNLVPCLLPEEEPEYEWNDDLTDTGIKEMKVVYTFDYLPAGLFNRAQVRLFEFSDKSTIWRYGSLLIKNNHRAVIVKTDDQHITTKIQGIRPDNILYMIHEVFEGLVNESFYGVTYDIAFPCPDCLEQKSSDPWQFSATLVRRAIELNSPSIQCHHLFHITSVTDLQALIPPTNRSNYDLHLEQNVRDLRTYKQNMTFDVVYLYPPDNIPSDAEKSVMIDPRQIKDDLTKHGLKIWSPDSMAEFKIENSFLIVKEARFIIFGISSELVLNANNKNLYDAYKTIQNFLRKPIIPIVFGLDQRWKETPLGISLTDVLYIKMQEKKRYDSKMQEIFERIDKGHSSDALEKVRNEPTDVFISYCWANSHDAVNKGTKPSHASLGWSDPRTLKDYLEQRQLSVWMDITRLGKSGVLHDIVQGLKNTKVFIACVSDEYTESDTCKNEFLFAKNTLRLPVILAVFGLGDKWRTTEVGMCSCKCDQINFQYENPTAFEDIYKFVDINLPKRQSSAVTKILTSTNKADIEAEENTTTAYQELFELTQRKFLRLTMSMAESMSVRPFPRLFALDFVGKEEKTAQEVQRTQLTSVQFGTVGDKQKEEEEKMGTDEREKIAETETTTETEKDDQNGKNAQPEKVIKKLCIRVLCEHEENWHPVGHPFEAEKTIIQNSSSYLSRIMLFLKHSELPMEIMTSDGEVELEKLNEDAKTAMPLKDSYGYLRRWVMDFDEAEKFCGVKQCLMPSGKILWLCEEHLHQPRVVLVTDSVASNTGQRDEEKNMMITALDQLNEKIMNNELASYFKPPVEQIPNEDKEDTFVSDTVTPHNKKIASTPTIQSAACTIM